MQGRPRFRGTAVVGVECNFPPWEDRRYAYRDVLPFF